MKNKLIYAVLIGLITMIGFELGGAVYEGVVVASQWGAHPPESFAILQGPYALPVEHFWIPLHMFVQVLIVAALVLCWKHKRVRNMIFIIVGLYLLLRIPTFLYFIPELNAFSTTEPTGAFSKELKERADLWANLSTVRTLIIASVYVLSWMALSRFNKRQKHVDSQVNIVR